MFNRHVTIAYRACAASYELAIIAIICFNELAGNYVFCVMYMYWLLARLFFAVLALCLSSLAHPCTLGEPLRLSLVIINVLYAVNHVTQTNSLCYDSTRTLHLFQIGKLVIFAVIVVLG